jgi:hypothetical protein
LASFSEQAPLHMFDEGTVTPDTAPTVVSDNETPHIQPVGTPKTQPVEAPQMQPVETPQTQPVECHRRNPSSRRRWCSQTNMEFALVQLGRQT